MPSRSPSASRRRFLGALASSVALPALLGPAMLRAQDAAEVPATEPFSFETLTETMRQAATAPAVEAESISGFLSGLDYDAYQRIRFNPAQARWQGEGNNFRLHAFHLGWLFKEPVHLFEVVDGQAAPMSFSTDDFDYSDLKQEIPEHEAMPGVAGFRLHTPLNRADTFDELIAFLGASYFRGLGRGTVYGLSARGLAVNTGLSEGEEFPRFNRFWLVHPKPGAASMTLYAALESPSLTGAYRFVITPGETTTVDVTARLFMRADVKQLGIAPLTSMFLFGGVDRGDFDDFRPAVHDSEALVINTRAGETLYRSLNNPPRLASSYFSVANPRSFGLVQRERDFESYLDAQAHYERRPSLMVEPLGNWGKGSVRLVEIPSDLEGNDNIVAFWIPESETRKGDALEFSYRQRWGLAPQGDGSVERARVQRVRNGKGGVAGVEKDDGRRKFVIDFAGGILRELPADAEVTPNVTASRGEIEETVLSKIYGTDTWRLVIEVNAEPGTVVELSASISGYGRDLTETWLYQWVKE